ncbi:hypothetical protein G7Y79_00019g047540 [Physcia stellaris]|nr:hypothetical protein G7Y79_00019g047540 [Physcia stellaris]
MPSATPTFSTSPPPTSFSQISFPAPHVLLVTLSRPKDLNCINSAGNAELDRVWQWLDSEPSLRIGIVTGEGRAFCAGADLKEWNTSNTSTSQKRSPMPPSGFGGLSRRIGKKPVIAAVNGVAMGGGCEIIINCDIVLASVAAKFALPEVKRGVIALAGALPRLVRTVGKQRAMEMALTGRTLDAHEARVWGLVNEVVEGEPRMVVERALEVATAIAANSPDSVVVSREGVLLGWHGLGAEEGTESLIQGSWKRMEGGENMKEGVKAFVEKRTPRWVDSKL